MGTLATPFQQIVLVVEDDPTLCWAYAQMLEEKGRYLIICRDFESAQIVIEQLPITHVLTGVKLTGAFRFEGLEVLDLVKRRAAGTVVIIVTGHDADDLRREAAARGADAFLQKPISWEELVPLLPRPDLDAEGSITFVPTLDDVLASGGLLTTAFQPVVWNEHPCDPAGFEALTRLRSNSLLANPELLFRYAERKRRTVELELFAAARSMHAGRELARLGFLSINIHPDVFTDPDRFCDSIMDSAAEAEVPPNRLVLEITEQGSLPDLQSVGAISAVLRAHGVRFAFDDVGSAHSHLRAIAAVRPAYLKISQHFGTSCESDPAHRKIVENIEQLARSFSSELVLEGIESEHTAEFARQMGITFGQGFYYGRPTDPATLLTRYRS